MMLRAIVFGLFGPPIGLLIAGTTLLQSYVVTHVRLLVAFMMMGFWPAVVLALVAALADTVLQHRRGFSRYARVTLTGSAAALGLCGLAEQQSLYFSCVVATAGGVSATLCCWLHITIEQMWRSRRQMVSGGT